VEKTQGPVQEKEGQVQEGQVQAQGQAVRVEPKKSKLKAPGTERLTLKYGNLHFNFAFKFNLRRCDKDKYKDKYDAVGCN
jgi:hypothetical protein